MLLSPMYLGAILFVYHCFLPINFIQLTALGACNLFLDLELSAYIRCVLVRGGGGGGLIKFSPFSQSSKFVLEQNHE